MTYLLDTHALLWALRSPETLPLRVREALGDGSAIFLISVVTPWEMSIKSALGKLDAAEILDNFEGLLDRGGFTLLETRVRHAVASGRLPLFHRDPFDRLLAAQALDLRIPIVSRDPVFDLYGVKRIWE